MPNFIIFFILALREFLCSLFEMWNRRAEFLGHLFFFWKRKDSESRRPLFVLNHRISTRSERTWTTTAYQSYHEIKSNSWQHYQTSSTKSMHVNASTIRVCNCTVTNSYCQRVPIFITSSTTFLKQCSHILLWEDLTTFKAILLDSEYCTFLGLAILDTDEG